MNDTLITRRRRRRARSRASIALASAAALALILAGCGSSGDDDDAAAGGNDVTTLRISHTGSVSNLPLWVAEEQGLFEKHGLDVKGEQVNTKTLSQVPALLGKQYDIGYGLGPTFLTAADKGIDIVVVSGSVTFNDTGDPSTNVIAGKDTGIKTPKDLEGKRLAASSLAGNNNLATMKWLIDQGVDVSKIKVVQANSSNMPDLIKAGKIDAAEVTMPFSGVLIADGEVNLGYPLKAVDDPVHMSFWIADRDWAKKNNDAVQKFRAALDEAAQWIADNMDEALALALEKAKLPAEYKEYVELPTFTTAMTGKDLQVWADAMKTVNGFTTDLDMNTLMYIKN